MSLNIYISTTCNLILTYLHTLACFHQLTSLSRLRERLLMGTGLVEAERMGGWGEEEEDEVSMGGDADEERAGG